MSRVALAAAGIGQTARALLRSRSLSLLGVTSTAAWLMPVAGLWIIVRQLGDPISGPAAAEVFSLGTLLGGAALLPLGADFTPRTLLGLLSGLERRLERSRFRSWSAHYLAMLVKRME